MDPVEVIILVQRRHRWTAEQKRGMVMKTEQLGMSLSAVARKYEIHPSHLPLAETLAGGCSFGDESR